ncbi:MAG TPA: aminoacyl-tRNA hydrolase [bacterium]|nr:aminoacyl-tRNA hydrolase [bacterium]
MEKIIVGLGNPGTKYAKTRHNAGWLLMDRLVAELEAETGQKINWRTKKDWSAEVAEIGDSLLVKPQTMMNNSGKAIRAILDYYNLLAEDLTNILLVIHDELDLPTGTTRWSTNSRAAGHNGVQSIIDYLGTQKFNRYRFGIQPAEKPTETIDYVLTKFSAAELKKLQQVDLIEIKQFINNISTIYLFC